MTDGDLDSPAAAPEPAQERVLVPTWGPWLLTKAMPRLVAVLIAAALGTLAIRYLIGKLTGFLFIIMMALFLSFAIEPAVNWLAARGWRRGAATGAIFGVLFLVVVVLVGLILPAIVSGAKQLVLSAPQIVDRLTEWLGRIGIDVSAERLLGEVQADGDKLAAYAADFAGNIFGIAGSVLGAILRWTTIALFTFYIVAEGPKFRRTICSVLPPDRQRRMLFVWDQAIEKTGGYFYSRLLLAVINGAGMYIILKVFNVPFAAPLALFEGIVAEFIPIVGTYIAGAVPTLVAFLTSTGAGIAALAYLIVYQQIENYYLSPRLTAKTMSLNPALAFGAAMLGASLGGVLMAFLALPVAGVAQAAVSAWVKRYDVVDDQLTSESAAAPGTKPKRSSFAQRLVRMGKDDDSDQPS